jgi:hypothetical protein
MLKHVPFQFNDRKGHGNMAAKLHCFLLKLQSAYKNYIKIMPLIPCQRVAIIMAILAPPSSRHLHTCRFSSLRHWSSRFLGYRNCMSNWHHHHKKGIFNAWQSLVQIMSATALFMSNYSIGTALWWVTRDPKSLQAITVACPNTLAPMR